MRAQQWGANYRARQTKGNSDQVSWKRSSALGFRPPFQTHSKKKIWIATTFLKQRTSKEGRFTPAVIPTNQVGDSGGKLPFLTCSLLEKCCCNPDLLFRMSLKTAVKIQGGTTLRGTLIRVSFSCRVFEDSPQEFFKAPLDTARQTKVRRTSRLARQVL